MQSPLSLLLIATGICALGFVAFVRIDSAIGEQRARAELTAHAAAEFPAPDTREWSEGRRKAWERSRTQPAGAPVGVLSIASIGLRVALRKGTDEITLNRGVGTVDGTRLESNLGIAGHRMDSSAVSATSLRAIGFTSRLGAGPTSIESSSSPSCVPKTYTCSIPPRSRH